jgi:hypothetical protein
VEEETYNLFIPADLLHFKPSVNEPSLSDATDGMVTLIKRLRAKYPSASPRMRLFLHHIRRNLAPYNSTLTDASFISDHRIALESALHLINSIASIHAMLKTLQYIDGKPTPLIPKSTTVLPTGMLAQLCQANIGR